MSSNYGPQRPTEIEGNLQFITSPRRKGRGGVIEIKGKIIEIIKLKGGVALGWLEGGIRRDRARVFDCPYSEQYIEIEVWSSIRMRIRMVIGSENDTRISFDLIEPKISREKYKEEEEEEERRGQTGRNVEQKNVKAFK